LQALKRKRGCELSGSSAPGHSAAAAGGGPSAAPTACMVSPLCSTAARGTTHHNPSYKSPDLFSYPTFTHVRLRQESHPPNLPTGNPVRCDSMSAVPPSSLTPMGACAPKVPYLHAKRDGENKSNHYPQRGGEEAKCAIIFSIFVREGPSVAQSATEALASYDTIPAERRSARSDALTGSGLVRKPTASGCPGRAPG
jgi:hypothetical protein